MPDEHSNEPALAEVQGRVLREFVANSPAGFLMLDHQLRHIEVSPRWAADWDQPRSELIGKHHYETHPDLPDHIKEAHRRALTGEVVGAAHDRFIVRGKEIRSHWEMRPWGDVKRREGGIIIYAENLERQSMAPHERAAERGMTAHVDPQPPLPAGDIVRCISLAQEGRGALQTLLSEYREIACTCGKEYYEEHRSHQLDCRAHPSVPLLVRAEHGVRQLFRLEQSLARSEDLES